MIELLCLANSLKRQERCIAGVRNDGTWVRPVSRDVKAQGGLSLSQIRLDDGSSPQLLDVIRIGLERACPAPYQPENHYVDASPWQLVSRPGDVSILSRLVEPGPELLGSRTDRIPQSRFEEQPALASLTVVNPPLAGMRWVVSLSNTLMRIQARAIFALSGQHYNLSVTDPVWRDRMFARGEGIYRCNELGVPAGASIYLTISLGEPFNGDCYKLVAAVIVLGA